MDQVGTSFQETIAAESKDIAAGRAAMLLPEATAVTERAGVEMHERAGEPWVAYAPIDRAGLALSGGGIRSSAFTLGLLQALSDRGVLPLFDYLSTVSGGGYTGGFWTSWLRAHGATEHFPGAPPPGKKPTECPPPKHLHEHPAIRHLREFSRFLAPRSGVGYIDLWEAALAAIVGMLPTLLFATALFATGIVLWRLTVLGIVWAALHEWWLPAVAGAASIVLFAAMERQWQRTRILPKVSLRWPVILGAAAIVAGLVATACAITSHPDSLVWEGDAIRPTNPRLDKAWAEVLEHPLTGLEQIRGYLLPGMLIGIAAAVWIVRWIRSWLAGWAELFKGDRPVLSNEVAGLDRALERSAARLMFFASIALVFAVLWHLSDVLIKKRVLGDLIETLGITGGISALATAAFGALRNLLLTSRSDDASGVLARIRPVLPQLLAGLTVLLYLTSITILCRVADAALPDSEYSILWLAVAPGVVLVLAGSDHRETGLHEFYRRRIARGFVQIDGDEVGIGRDLLRHPTPLLQRPVHLVCCAANSVADDPLHTLYRGAKSAVLSTRGLSIANDTWPQNIRLSDALTASAAAFNSQMGGNSLRLGPAVSTLMTALNLRLGLWLRKSANASLLDFGGVRLWTEMFGLTRADKSWVHLSDGGHFDNLGAYELVRRHCRYIVVADCGADPKVRFDDLSELIRRVREDFGVEIEIDIAPLRPDADGHSRQHIVVGNIFYGPRPTSDVGTLIVVKPTLTGDEPPDVTQYRARNAVFPHESTGDQFFDEPQWESYRRLGEHCGRSAFAYVADLSDDQRHHGERVFSDAARRWQPLPPDAGAASTALAGRCAAIEDELRTAMPTWLLHEFIPELASDAPKTERSPYDDARVFVFFVQVLQLLEDAWLTCDLDTHGMHPQNEGWFAYIARWASMPELQRLWPLLRPIYAPGFRELMKRRFDFRVRGQHEVASGADPTRTATAKLMGAEVPADARPPSIDPDASGMRSWYRLTYELELPGPSSITVEVGTAMIETVGNTLYWRLADMKVPATLHGAGVVGRFLDAVIQTWGAIGIERIVVVVPPPRSVVDLAEHSRTLGMYRSRGFRLDRPGTRLVCSATLSRPVDHS